MNLQSSTTRFGLNPLPQARPNAGDLHVNPVSMGSLSSATATGDEWNEAAVFRPLDSSLAAQADSSQETDEDSHARRSRQRNHRHTAASARPAAMEAPVEYYADSVWVSDPIETTTDAEGASRRVRRGARHGRERSGSSSGGGGKEGKRRRKKASRERTRTGSRGARYREERERAHLEQEGRQRRQRSRGVEVEDHSPARRLPHKKLSRSPLQHQQRQQGPSLDPLGPLPIQPLLDRLDGDDDDDDDDGVDGPPQQPRQQPFSHEEYLQTLLEENRGVPGEPIGGIIPPRKRSAPRVYPHSPLGQGLFAMSPSRSAQVEQEEGEMHHRSSSYGHRTRSAASSSSPPTASAALVRPRGSRSPRAVASSATPHTPERVFAFPTRSDAAFAQIVQDQQQARARQQRRRHGVAKRDERLIWVSAKTVLVSPSHPAPPPAPASVVYSSSSSSSSGSSSPGGHIHDASDADERDPSRARPAPTPSPRSPRPFVKSSATGKRAAAAPASASARSVPSPSPRHIARGGARPSTLSRLRADHRHSPRLLSIVREDKPAGEEEDAEPSDAGSGGDGAAHPLSPRRSRLCDEGARPRPSPSRSPRVQNRRRTPARRSPRDAVREQRPSEHAARSPRAPPQSPSIPSASVSPKAPPRRKKIHREASKVRREGNVKDAVAPRTNLDRPGPAQSPTAAADTDAGALVTLPEGAIVVHSPPALSPPQPTPPSLTTSPPAAAPLTRRAAEETLLHSLQRPHRTHDRRAESARDAAHRNGWRYPYEWGDGSADEEEMKAEADLAAQEQLAAVSAALARTRAALASRERCLLHVRCSLIAAYCHLGGAMASACRRWESGGSGDGTDGPGAGASLVPPASRLVYSPALEEQLQRLVRRTVRKVGRAGSAWAAQEPPQVDSLMRLVHASTTDAVRRSRYAPLTEDAELPTDLPIPVNLSLTSAAPITGALDLHTAALFSSALTATGDAQEATEATTKSRRHGSRRGHSLRDADESRGQGQRQGADREREPRHGWRTCFAVANDRGLTFFASASDYACRRYDRVLGIVPYEDMLLFVPDFLAEPAHTVVAASAAAATGGGGDGSDSDATRSGKQSAISPFLPAREEEATALSRAYVDLLAQLVHKYHLTDPQAYYFGFVPRGATATWTSEQPFHQLRAAPSLALSSVAPPVVMRVRSDEAHRHWTCYIASRVNRHLYQTLFPPSFAAPTSHGGESRAEEVAFTVYDQLSVACQTDAPAPQAAEGGGAASTTTAERVRTTASVATQAGNPTLKAAHLLRSSADKAAGQPLASPQRREAKKGAAKRRARVAAAAGAGPGSDTDSPHYRESTREDPSPGATAEMANATVPQSPTDDGARQTPKVEAEGARRGGDAVDRLADLPSLLRRKEEALRKATAAHSAVATALAESEQRRLALRDDKQDLSDQVRELSVRVAELTAAEASQRAELARLRAAADDSAGLPCEEPPPASQHVSGAVGRGAESFVDASRAWEQERAAWHAERRALEEKNRVLAAEVVALRDHRTDSIRALAARAVGDLDAFHAGVLGSVEDYLASLDRTDAAGRAPQLPVQDGTRRHHVLADGAPPTAAWPSQADTHTDKESGGAKGFALLLLTFDGAMRLLDCCLTVDETEAKLMHSGPTRQRTGREWTLHHYGSDAELRLEMGVVKVSPLRPWELPCTNQSLSAVTDNSPHTQQIAESFRGIGITPAAATRRGSRSSSSAGALAKSRPPTKKSKASAAGVKERWRI